MKFRIVAPQLGKDGRIWLDGREISQHVVAATVNVAAGDVTRLALYLTKLEVEIDGVGEEIEGDIDRLKDLLGSDSDPGPLT